MGTVGNQDKASTNSNFMLSKWVHFICWYRLALSPVLDVCLVSKSSNQFLNIPPLNLNGILWCLMNKVSYIPFQQKESAPPQLFIFLFWFHPILTVQFRQPTKLGIRDVSPATHVTRDWTQALFVTMQINSTADLAMEEISVQKAMIRLWIAKF